MALSQSAYPVIVLEALRQGLVTIEEIKRYGYDKYEIALSARTIRRHIKLIESLTYKVTGEQDSPVASPRSLERITFEIDQSVRFGSAAYALMILTVLEVRKYPHKQRSLIGAIKFAFNETKIERKALGRNIKVLIDMGYNIQHNKTGYCLVN